MESVGSTEEGINLNSPVPASYIIYSYCSSHPFFPQVSNTDAAESRGGVSGEGDVTEEARKSIMS